MKNDALSSLNLIGQTIYDKKGSNILALDVRGISSITDYIIIAEGSATQHVTAIARAIMEELNCDFRFLQYVEGLSEGEWVVLDFFDFMVHLFAPNMREKYQLEELWKEGEIIDLNIQVGPQLVVACDRPYRR